MTREELIKQCRYYKGERQCPPNTTEMWWEYEERWVTFSLEGDPFLRELEQDYIQAGLASIWEDDGVPLGIKAILFNRYCHWSGNMSPEECVASFRSSYPFDYV